MTPGSKINSVRLAKDLKPLISSFVNRICRPLSGLVEKFECSFRSHLSGFLLCASASEAVNNISYADLHGELSVVVGSAAPNDRVFQFS